MPTGKELIDEINATLGNGRLISWHDEDANDDRLWVQEHRHLAIAYIWERMMGKTHNQAEEYLSSSFNISEKMAKV